MVTKGQFSLLPTDSAIEVDGGKPIGNANKFPWDSYGEAGKAVIDEVNMLRNDVSQRAASSGNGNRYMAMELMKIAHEVLVE